MSGLNRSDRAWRDRGGEIVRADARVLGLPAGFRRHFLGLLGGAPWASTASLVGSYWALRLEQRPALRARIVDIVARAGSRCTAALGWIQALEEVANERQLTLAEVLLETGAFAREVTDRRAVVRRLEALCDDHHYRERAEHLLQTIVQSRSPIYALDGFELANEHDPDRRLEQHGDTTRALEAVRRATAVICGPDGNHHKDGFGLRLWQRCGELAGFAELLADLPWTALDRDGAFQLAELLASVGYLPEGTARARLWERLRSRAPAIARALQGLEPAYRSKACRHVEDLLWVWEDEPRVYDRALCRYLALLPRFCLAPLSTAAGTRGALSSLSRLGEAHWRWIETSSHEAWRELERACRRTSDAQLISDGLWTMAAVVPQLTARAFATATRTLLRAAKALGCTPAAMRETILDACRNSPLFRAKPLLLGLPDLVRTLEASGSPQAAAAVSRRLREHLRGARPASRARLERDRNRIVGAWDRVLVGRIEAATVEHLAANLRLHTVPRTPAERHALLFQRGARAHRRAVRKLLNARLAGNRDYPLSHPVSRRWLAVHPRIDERIWTHGIELRGETRSHGPVVIRLERDPLEVLRMGSYVGSCFALGGSFAESAVAVALDVNKQVAFCRDRRGVFVARQVLAISEAERLHCYEVYPVGAAPEIHSLFRLFDLRMSAALGTALHTPGDADDEDDDIPCLLSKDCYLDLPITVDFPEQTRELPVQTEPEQTM